MASESSRSPSPPKLFSPRVSPPREVSSQSEHLVESSVTTRNTSRIDFNKVISDTDKIHAKAEGRRTESPATEPHERPQDISLQASEHPHAKPQDELQQSLQAGEGKTGKTVPDVVPAQEANDRRSRMSRAERPHSRPPPAASSGARRLKALPRSQSVEATNVSRRTPSASGTVSQRSRPSSQVRAQRSADQPDVVSPTSESARGFAPSVGTGSRLTSTSRTLRGSRSTLFSTSGRSVLSEISPFRITKRVPDMTKLSLGRQTSASEGVQAAGDSLFLPSYKSYTLPAKHDHKSYAERREAREAREQSTERGSSTNALTHSQTLFQNYRERRWPDFAVHPEWTSEAVTRSKVAASEARGDVHWFWSLRIGTERRPNPNSGGMNTTAAATNISSIGTSVRSASSKQTAGAPLGSIKTWTDTAQRLGMRTTSAPVGEPRV